jgi:hypothetical protein
MDAKEEGKAQISPNNIDGMYKEEKGKEQTETSAGTPKHSWICAREGDQGHH